MNNPTCSTTKLLIACLMDCSKLAVPHICAVWSHLVHADKGESSVLPDCASHWRNSAAGVCAGRNLA
jgi:hypothetical protein